MLVNTLGTRPIVQQAPHFGSRFAINRTNPERVDKFLPALITTVNPLTLQSTLYTDGLERVDFQVEDFNDSKVKALLKQFGLRKQTLVTPLPIDPP
jgi:hypothetical protein